MKFRKKHNESSEVFTDSLNDILFILLMFFLIVATVANPNIVPVNNPRGSKEMKAKQDIVVSINKDQTFFIGQARVDYSMLDSLLIKEINKHRTNVKDTPTVIINADTIAYFGEVYRVMRLAKGNGAKVAAMVK
jgi:biopolymer transport protein ExbD